MSTKVWEWLGSPEKCVCVDGEMVERTEPPTHSKGGGREELELNESRAAIPGAFMMKMDDVGCWLHFQNISRIQLLNIFITYHPGSSHHQLSPELL